jgi:hypothetical protein
MQQLLLVQVVQSRALQPINMHATQAPCNANITVHRPATGGVLVQACYRPAAVLYLSTC